MSSPAHTHDKDGGKKRRISDGEDSQSAAAAEARAGQDSIAHSERGHDEHVQKWRRVSPSEGGPVESSIVTAPAIPTATHAPLRVDTSSHVGSDGAPAAASSISAAPHAPLRVGTSSHVGSDGLSSHQDGAAAASAVQGTKKMSVAEKLMVCRPSF